MEDFYERFWTGKLDTKPSKTINQRLIEIINKYFDNDPYNPQYRFKCLDVGCGEGNLSNGLNETFNVIGIDVSRLAIKKAKQKYPNIIFKHASATDLPFKDEEFNCIVANQLIEHILDTEKMFYEFNRVLMRYGYLFISTPQLTFLKNLAISLFCWEDYYRPTHSHIRFYTKNTLEKILNKFGFEIIHYEMDGSWLRLIPKGMLVVAKKVMKL